MVVVTVVVAGEEEGGGGAAGEPSECEIRGIPGIHCNGCLPPKLDSKGMTNSPRSQHSKGWQPSRSTLAAGGGGGGGGGGVGGGRVRVGGGRSGRWGAPSRAA